MNRNTMPLLVDGATHADGWMGRRGEFTLPGGGAARLALRAHVLPCDGQTLTLRLDGDEILAEAVADGTLHVRIPIPASAGPRRVDVEWARTVELSQDDPRLVAAQIDHLDLVPLRSPTALRIPESLAVWGSDQVGIDDDGWTGSTTTVRLGAGPAALLAVRGAVPEALDGQELAVYVDGDELDRESLGSGPFAIAMPVASSDDDRTIELRWADTTHPSSSDDREVAARLAFVGLVAGNAPSAVASNLRALSDPHLRFRGVHPDGWLEQSATLELRQAHHTELVVKARTLPGVESRSLEIRLDGEIVQRVETDATFVAARVSVAPTTHDTRRVDLRWSSADPLSSSDSRRVAAHLAFVGFVTPRPPAVIDRSTDPADPQLETDGLHEDFWLAETSQLTLAGGPPCDLLLRAELDRARTQTVDVLVNGVVVGSADARGTSVELRTPLPASDDKRIVELRWSNAFNVTTADPRAVSARLVQLGLEAQRTSLARRLVPHRR